MLNNKEGMLLGALGIGAGCLLGGPLGTALFFISTVLFLTSSASYSRPYFSYFFPPIVVERPFFSFHRSSSYRPFSWFSRPSPRYDTHVGRTIHLNHNPTPSYTPGYGNATHAQRASARPDMQHVGSRFQSNRHSGSGSVHVGSHFRARSSRGFW